MNEEGTTTRLSRGELRQRVAEAQAGLRDRGVGPGDRIAAIARNDCDAVIACLATAAVGASWSAVAPDLGPASIADRFAPLRPKLVLAHADHPYHGVRRSLADRIAAAEKVATVVTFDALPRPGASLGVPERFAFNHPLFVLFSSGTTGAPKCIVHGAGGTLLEHHKEHRLHVDLRTGDKLLFHTSTGWMMWNWQLSALACGAEIVLYDGSVSYPEQDSLWRLVDRERVTVFGTSPSYLQFTRDSGIVPRERFAFEALRSIQSTGSILSDAVMEWTFEHVKRVPIQSISGGTDIVGCFLLGNPNLPVHAGELQSKSLALDVRVQPVAGLEPVGELICAAPFPSRPVHFLNDPGGQRFHDAYFSQNDGVWTHGDFLELTASGGARIHGRSDGVLNIRGIRIGPSEIYRALEAFPEIGESMAVEQIAPDGTRLVLLVVLKNGATLDRALGLRIKKEIKERCSQVHVPAVIAKVSELPTTHSGKRSYRAAQDSLNGKTPSNLSALKNPDCLAELRALAAENA